MSEQKQAPYACDQENAGKIYDWLVNRGGILIWRSVNLSNPSGSWTSPALDSEGNPYKKPNWQCGDAPERHITDVNDVTVYTSKELKRFHVATRMGGNGLSIKVTDAGSRRIRAEVDKAAHGGRPAWYVFDYGSDKNCVIMIEDSEIPMKHWIENKKEVACI